MVQDYAVILGDPQCSTALMNFRLALFTNAIVVPWLFLKH